MIGYCKNSGITDTEIFSPDQKKNTQQWPLTMTNNMDKNNGCDIPNRYYGITPQWSTAKPMFLTWDKMEQMYETIKQLPEMINYIKELACVSFLVQEKKKLVEIVLSLEEIISERQNDDLQNKEMDGGDIIPDRFRCGVAPQLWTPTNPMLLICDEMKETIKKLPNEINYIKECASVGFLVWEKEKLAEIVVTLEKIIDKKQKEKNNNNGRKKMLRMSLH